VSTHTGISTVAFAMALSLAAAGPVPPGLAQVAPAPRQTGQDHDAHHPGANAEVPPAATPAPAPTQTTRSPMAIMGLGGPPGIMGDMRQMMRNTMTMMSPALVFMYVKLARTEERESLATFGDGYRQYIAEVPGFIPRFDRLFGQEPKGTYRNG